MAIDEKMATVGQAAHARFGDGMPAKTFIKTKDQKRWIAKHKVHGKEDETDIVTRKNVEFAKDLFLSWDDDGSGELSANEIIKPLVSLGLAPDSEFARRILSALDPRTKAEKERTDLKITLPDFIKIFRSSKVSDCLLNIIQKESEKRYLKHQQAMMVNELPNRRFDHPMLT